MACNIIFNLGNEDSQIEIKTIPNYKLKFRWCFKENWTTNIIYGNMCILLDYYDSSNCIPIVTKKSCNFSLLQPININIHKGFRRIIKCLKNKTSTNFHLLRWESNNTWRHIHNSSLSRFYDLNNLKLQLNDDAVDQFIDELEQVLKFLQLVDYKYQILHPSIKELD